MPASNVEKILLVGDYGQDDLAFKEVTQRLYEWAEQMGKHVQIDIISVDPFKTDQTAAVVAQAAKSGEYDMVYHNTAPRKDAKQVRKDNDGEPLAYTTAMAGNGKKVKIVGVYAADETGINTFAMLPKGEVRKIRCETKGSQFRSRDLFPYHVIAAMAGTLEFTKDAPLPVTHHEELKDLRDYADDRLQASKHQLSRHGNASKKYVTVIGPRGQSDALIARAARRFGEEAEIDMLPIKYEKGAAWLEAGFAAAQLALSSEQKKRRAVIALTGQGKGNYIATLDNGATLETDDLRVLGFVKSHIQGHGLEMRGRDATRHRLNSGLFEIVPGADPKEAFADMIRPAGDNLKELPLETIPHLPDDPTIAYIDGYGNMKLAMARDALVKRLEEKSGLTIGDDMHGTASVTLRGKTMEPVFISGGSFSVEHGQMALSRGSSGWAARFDTYGEEPKDHFTEIFLRGGNAASQFGDVAPGDVVEAALKEVNKSKQWGSKSSGIALPGDAPARVVIPR